MPLFVSLEGIEGSGKSTLQKNLEVLLKGGEIILTREPGGTELGASIRKLLLDRESGPVAPAAELALFAADRAQHVAEVIAPALARGAIVISDRYIHSTLAYQGYGRGLPLEQLSLLNSAATGGLEPDLVLLLDLPAEAGLARARGRGEQAESWTRFEEEKLAFHRRVREGYLALARLAPEAFTVLDAQLTPELLALAAAAEIKKKLAQRG